MQSPLGPAATSGGVRSHAPEDSAPSSGFDLQDVLLVAGVVFAEAAALVIWWPAALILLSLFGFGFAYLIERAKSKDVR